MKHLLSLSLKVMLLIYGFTSAQTLVTHDFNDNSLGPFNECTTRSPNFSRAQDGRLVTHWREDGYRGNRLSAGAEACADQVVFSKEGWYGMKFELGADYSQHSQGAIAQIFGSRQEFGTWSGLLELEQGELVAIHRRGAGTPQRFTVIDNVQNEREYSVVVHFILSGINEGLFEVWIDGERVYQARNISFGLGNFNSNDVLDVPNHNFQTFKIGMYNYASNDYIENETRTIYYDDVSWYNGGSEGFDIVNPDSSGSSVVNEGIVNFTPDPSKTYYIDSPVHDLRIGSTGNSEDPFTTSTNTTGADVEWKFSSNGNGSWYIDRADGGSLPRLRTDASEFADMQSTASDGRWESFIFTEGALNGSSFITSSNGPEDFRRLQVNPDGDIRMTPDTFDGTWESFIFTEVEESGSSNNGGAQGESTVVHITKSNARGFALDGNRGAENEQSVYLWEANQNNVNQQWIEIDRGNGFYSYQKMGTNHCIDGGRSGENRQDIYLYDCGINNFNQYWEKVEMRDGSFQLVKRNASDFAIDGGSGGANAQNVQLYDSSVTSQNIQWVITPIDGLSAKSLSFDTTEVTVYPNPVATTATIQGAADTTVRIYDMNGQIVLTKQVSTDSENIDLSNLSTGVYYTQVKGLLNTTVLKVIKK